MKGKIHAIATAVYICLIPRLHVPEPIQIPVCIYIASVLCHFASSTVLHIYPWSGRKLSFFRKLDHSVIFIKIVATYWVFINTIIPDVNIYLKISLYGGAILGILSRLLHTDAPQIFVVIPYLMVGWSALLDHNSLKCLIVRSPETFIWGIIGGICISFGSVIYILRRPNPIPDILEFHELFHICGVIGTICLGYAIHGYAIPYHQSVH